MVYKDIANALICSMKIDRLLRQTEAAHSSVLLLHNMYIYGLTYVASRGWNWQAFVVPSWACI